MAGWMKALAVALAAVVGLVPTFAQVSYAQTLSEQVPVLPFGEELEDTTLVEVDGEALPVLASFLVKAAKWVCTVLLAAERLASYGCQKAVQLASQAATKVGELTIRAVTFTAVQATQHPLARDTVVGTLLGMGGTALTAEIKNEPLTLKDVALGALTGAGAGALGHGIARGLETVARGRR